MSEKIERRRAKHRGTVKRRHAGRIIACPAGFVIVPAPQGTAARRRIDPCR
jgi:hypothetical protein